MSVDTVQRGVLYTKEIQDIGLFAVMTDSRLFTAFSGSPLYFIMLPMIGLLLTVLALINGYHLVKASNRNFDKWSSFIISAICAVLASTSLYGSTIATALGITFAAGPWLFIASVCLAFVHQTVMFGINIVRANESMKSSAQRMHYVQALSNNALNLLLLVAVMGAITFVMLLPIAPLVATAFSATALLLTAGNIVWRLTPYNWKQTIKEGLDLGKPQVIGYLGAHESSTTPNPVISSNQFNHQRMFSCPDYSAEIKVLTKEKAKIYLDALIDNKLELFNALPDGSEKSAQKSGLLTKLRITLNNTTAISKKALLEEFPLAFQNFWAEKGDVEQITDAVIEFGITKSEPSPSLEFK